MIRRLVAAVTWVLLLHLNLVASDLVCAQHSETSAMATPAMQHHASMSGTQKTSVTDGDKDACQVPARTDCCRAMASCTVNIGIGASLLAVAPAIVRVIAAAGSSHAPVSFVVAPEPPPPKA